MEDLDIEDLDIEDIWIEIKDIFKTIHLKEPQEQAKYGNPNLKDTITSGKLNTLAMLETICDKPFGCWTISDVGNLAYMSLNSPFKEKFKKALEEYKKFREKNPQITSPQPERVDWHRLFWDSVEVVRDLVKMDIQL